MQPTEFRHAAFQISKKNSLPDPARRKTMALEKMEKHWQWGHASTYMLFVHTSLLKGSEIAVTIKRVIVFRDLVSQVLVFEVLWIPSFEAPSNNFRISMSNQMATSEIKKIISRVFCQNSDNFPRLLGEGNYQNFDKTQVKLFPNFTRKLFDYLLMSWVTNYAHNQGVWKTRIANNE